MPSFDWDAELTEEQRDALIDRITQQVAKRGMHAPAILLLEMHKPISFLIGQGIVLGSGVLAPLFGPDNVRQASRLLESPDNIERLIRRIEEDAVRPEHSKT